MGSAGPAAMGSGGSLLLRIEPLDTLFFRDARPFGPRAQGTSVLPGPQTVTGALRTAMLRKAGVELGRVAAEVRSGKTFGAAAAAAGGAVGAAIGAVRFRGPGFGRDGDALFPAPSTLWRVSGDGRIVRLDPLGADLPGWKPPEAGMKPLWRRGRDRLSRVEGYLDRRAMERFLRGGQGASWTAASRRTRESGRRQIGRAHV